MSDTEEIKTLLQSHISDSNKFRDGMNKAITEIKVHGEYTEKRLKIHGKIITDLEDTSNKQKGALWVIVLIGIGTFVDFIVDLFQKKP